MSDDTSRLPFLEMGTHFSELASALSRTPGSPPDPERIVRLAARAIPQATDCSLTLVRLGRPLATLAATGDLPRRVDALQHRTQQGPCLDASRSQDVVLVDDLRADARWPGLTSAAAAHTAVRSLLCVRVLLAGEDRAVITFHAPTAGAFTDRDTGVAAIFAPFAGLAVQAVLHRTDTANLTAALTSSRQIGTAIGILMARRMLTSQQAFDQLRRASMHLNRKLRDIAEEVELTGELPLHEPEEG